MNGSHVRNSTPWMVVALGVALAGCGGDSMGPTGGGGGGGGGNPVETTSVTVSDNFFNPAAIKVAPGATVTWTWGSSGTYHNVTFSDASIGVSGNRNTGTYSATMPTAPGTYNYVCTIHESFGMTGTVTVSN